MSQINKPTTINRKKILLVEGRDEEVFFKVILTKMEIQDIIQIIPTGGKQQFSTIFPAIINVPGFNQVGSLAIIQDADNDASATFQSICSTLNKRELHAPVQIGTFTRDTPKIGVFIIPDGKSTGILESLCLSTIESRSIMKCVDSFMDCVTKTSKLNESAYNKPKNVSKARCRAFLSAMEDDTPSLGIATEKDYWDLTSNRLKPLLHFLKQI